MTKREFVDAYVLRHVTPKSSREDIRTIVFNAQFVWATVEETADREEPRPMSQSNWFEAVWR